MKPGRSGPFPYIPINRRPRITWPGGARVALWVIPNIETFPLDEPVPGGTGKAPDLINWAPRDYGNRVGVFRVMEVLTRHGVRGTVALNSEVCDDCPPIIEDAVELGWEFMALGYILRHEGVWRATGSEIVDHYLASGATF